MKRARRSKGHAVAKTSDPLPPDLWEGDEVLPLQSAAPITATRPVNTGIAVATRLIRGDHVELGERLRDGFERDGVLSFANDALWQCNGKAFFERLDDSSVARDVHTFAGSAVSVKMNKPLALKNSDVKGAIAVLKDMVADPNFFHDAPKGISFRDCFVELDGSKFVVKKNGPENRARHQLPFAYAPNAAPPHKILAFFGDCFGGSEDPSERIECIREMVGLCLVGLGTRFHRALVLHGGGANGKSVLINLIQRAFPETATSAVAAQRWGHEYNRAALAGKRINMVSELPEGDIIDSSSFKAIISGDVTQGRHPYGRPFDFHPEAGHVFATNTLPGTNDQTEGFWRRFILIGFPNTVPLERQDPFLIDRLAHELPQFVGWCLAGAAAAIGRGAITIPPSSTPALEAWRLESDQVAAWLNERCEESDLESGTLASTLYYDYKFWAEQNGHKRLSSTSFGKRLKLRGVTSSHTRRGMVYGLATKTTLHHTES
jgi:putative DNA primase/helicase